LTNELLDPADGYKDVMSYCHPSWTSDYGYQLLVERVVAVNNQRKLVVSSGGVATKKTYRTLLVDSAGTARWGLSMSIARDPDGVPEFASVLDASGAVLETVRVYRAELEDTGGQLLYVPDAQAGWDSLLTGGGILHSFAAPITVTPFSQ
jgi:hypothetical protein